ncbi:MAG: BatD family protein [Bacteroidia bacterium]
MKLRNPIYNIAKKGFAIFVLLIISQQFASAPQLKATADKTTVLPNEVFTVTYSVDADGDDFGSPSFRDFEVLSGPNVSTRISVYNTQMMRNTSYSFLLRATKTGTFNIAPASVEVKGKRIRSNSLKITVTNSGNTPSAQGNNKVAPKANIFGKDNVFLQLNANKKEVYQGEAIAVNSKIYLRDVNIQEYQFLNPSFEGFWVEEITLPKPTEVTPERVNGKVYQAGTIRKGILYPQKSGKLKIGPLELEVIGTKNMSRNLLDDFFSGRSGGFFDDEEPIRALISSNALQVNVKPLPQPQPQNFSGFVGDVKIVAKLSNFIARANEPVTLTVTVAGKGNFNNVQPFKIDLGDAAEVYTPETAEELDNTGNDITGTKTFTYTIVPRKEGKLFIPPVKLSYFDPQQGKYIQQQSNGFNLNVEKGVQSAQQDSSPAIVANENKDDKNLWQKIPVWLWILLIALPLAGLLLYWFKRKKSFVIPSKPAIKKTVKNKFELAKNAQLTEDVNYKLQEAEEWFSRNHLSLFYASLWQALQIWLQQQTGLQPAELNTENIRQVLSNKHTSAEDIERIINLLQKLEFIRYAPVSQQQDDAKAALDEAKHFSRK